MRAKQITIEVSTKERSSVRFSKKNIVAATLATVAATLLVITQTAGTIGGQQSYKLQGAWIQTVPGTPVLATMVFSPDPSGLRASISGKLAVRISAAQAFPDNESGGEFVGEAVMTGPDTAAITVIGYGTLLRMLVLKASHDFLDSSACSSQCLKVISFPV